MSDAPAHDHVAVQRFTAGGSEVAVLQFEGRLRELLISSLRTNYLMTGNYAPDAKAVSPQGALSMVAAGAAAAGTGLSAAFSSTLFMATANPASLMQIGAGVGSAVMGPTGIIAQAAFIPIAGSLPVVAPLMAMQALTTAIMLQQFKQVDRKLDVIKNTLDTAIARTEATHAGELLTASRVVDEIYAQYELSGSFSTDMLIRLALAEHDVRRLAERFRFLVDSHATTDVDEVAQVQRANHDAHSAMLASFLDLRIGYLRVCVDMQENPRSVGASVAELKNTIKYVTDFWQQLRGRSEALRTAIKEREGKLADMGWAERMLPEFIGGRGAAAEKKLTALRDAYVATMESELGIIEGFDSAIQSAKQTLTALEAPQDNVESSPALVYWRDEEGEHSFSTERLQVAAS